MKTRTEKLANLLTADMRRLINGPVAFSDLPPDVAQHMADVAQSGKGWPLWTRDANGQRRQVVRPWPVSVVVEREGAHGQR